MEQRLLVIGHTLPEPNTTAAGVRMEQLLTFFLAEGYSIVFTTTANPTPFSATLGDRGIRVETIRLNDPKFNEQLKRWNPSVVMFDRFLTEEQFGWRVAEACPNALRILDTEDLHFLRKAREEAHHQGQNILDANLYTELAKRELASILRCDLSLIISEAEMELLQTIFKVPSGLLCYLPFLAASISEEQKKSLPKYKERTGFCTLGNLKHKPNVDAVLFLKKEIWPLVRSKLPNAELKIYGAYAPANVAALHSAADGFLYMGWAPSAHNVLQKSRVCLAPLRYGAGLKGKLFDAMRCGTPSVTTWIGAEGLAASQDFGGILANGAEEIAEAAVQLYCSEEGWTEAQQRAFQCLENRFDRQHHIGQFRMRIDTVLHQLPAHRQRHFLGQILHHSTLQSTKYLSKWIECKNGK